ncbi:hypothetical protein AB0B66_21990 [Catellatospora sp. NPDC049111]|uniref:hypothetical protein n=1 Tax=Catellatospora sp. NPDC049111 TaxID=3155271 RepID=UPI0033D95285
MPDYVVIKIDGSHLDSAELAQVTAIAAELGADVELKQPDAGALELLAAVAVVLAPLAPFFQGMLSRLGEEAAGRLLELVERLRKDGQDPMIEDIDTGTGFVFDAGARTREAAAAAVTTDVYRLNDGTELRWDAVRRQWRP